MNLFQFRHPLNKIINSRIYWSFKEGLFPFLRSYVIYMYTWLVEKPKFEVLRCTLYINLCNEELDLQSKMCVPYTCSLQLFMRSQTIALCVRLKTQYVK